MTFFFVRFFALVIWYRCTAKGNIIESTLPVFYIRLATDLFLYGMTIWGMMPEEVSSDASGETQDGAIVTPIDDSTESSDDIPWPSIIFMLCLFVKEVFAGF